MVPSLVFGLTDLTKIELRTEDIENALATAWELVRAEGQIVPFENWDESVFRWMFIKALRQMFPGMECEIEWNRVDLLIRATPRILIEFKFYFGPQQRRDLDGKKLGWKGGFGPKNFAEFCDCVQKQAMQMIKKFDVSSCRRFIVLGYASHPNETAKRLNAALTYDEVCVPDEIASRIELTRLKTFDGLGDAAKSIEYKCALFEVRPKR